MKGFPNQISDLLKLTKALGIASDVVAKGEDLHSNAVYGEALVRGGVVGPRDKSVSIDEYLKQQNLKPPSGRSHETNARGLREFFRLAGLLADDDRSLTPEGEKIASQVGTTLTDSVLQDWREAARRIALEGDNGVSHPYLVLLRLVAERPGITRAKCALALEARDDSRAELNRIVGLSDADEYWIKEQTGVTDSNWNNAQKILPSLAERLGDVIKEEQRMYLAQPEEVLPAARAKAKKRKAPSKKGGPSSGRSVSAREVSAETIAQAGTTDSHDEVDPESSDGFDPEAIAAAKKKLRDRLTRHNLLVKQAAKLLEANGAKLLEGQFDCLAIFDEVGLLLEAKTLDGSAADERIRVRHALAQLLYYGRFLVGEHSLERPVRKVALFEGPINPLHVDWLCAHAIEVVWQEKGELVDASRSSPSLEPYMGTVKASS